MASTVVQIHPAPSADAGLAIVRVLPDVECLLDDLALGSRRRRGRPRGPSESVVTSDVACPPIPRGHLLRVR